MHEYTVRQTWQRPIEPPATVPGSADIVIIGGGIVGVSTAWFLAKQGVEVLLCEKGHIAGEQSGGRGGRGGRVVGIESAQPLAASPMLIGKGEQSGGRGG